MRKKLISACLILGLLLGQAVCLNGCGEKQVLAEEEIELIEPVGSVPGSEVAVRRTLYNSLTYEVLVEPKVEEYSYSEARNFLSTDVKLGDKVKAGDIIYNADIATATKKIEQLQEKLDALTESYEEYRKELEDTLYVQRLELERLEEDLEDVMDAEPKDKTGVEYAAWLQENKSYTGSYNKKELDVRMNEEALRQKTELYQLDYDYYTAQITELKQQNAEGIIRSKIDGQVIQLELRSEGDYVASGRTVVTVADMDYKIVACDGLEKALIKMSKEIYAFFDGEKYALIYDEEASIYDKSTSHSVFVIQDPNNEVPVGSYGSVVLYTKMRENAVTVPSEAIHVNGLERYVYVLEDGKTVAKTVKLGINDGFYTEILSGIEEGECVLLERSDPKAVNTLVLEKKTIGMAYTGQADLYYPVGTAVVCGVENGTVFFEGWAGGFDYTRVGEGLTVAYVHVEGDEQELLEKEVELKRAKERLADLIAEGKESNEKTIKSRQKAIAEQEEELAQLVKDYNTTEVRTEKAGVLSRLNEYLYDSATKKSVRIQVGDELPLTFSYAYLYDESIGYLILPENESYGELGYNTMLSFVYTNLNNENVRVEAPVTNVNYGGKVRQGLLLSREILQDINLNGNSTWGASKAITKFVVTGTVKTVKNVVVLPPEALQNLNNNFCYVNVLQEDGTIRSTAVIVGGKYIDENRQESYWVVEGLTEGMTVCWE